MVNKINSKMVTTKNNINDYGFGLIDIKKHPRQI